MIVTLQPGPGSGIDTHLEQVIPDGNFGVASSMTAGEGTDGRIYKGLIEFDLSSLPADITIISATLRLRCSFEFSAIDSQISIHRSLVDWFVGNQNGSPPGAGVDGSTWNERNANGSVAWSGGAGGGSGSDYASSATDTTLVTAQAAFYDWDVLADVSDWYSEITPNRGWWIIGEGGTNTAKSFNASEIGPPNAPQLIIEYSSGGDISGLSSGTSTAEATLMAQGRISGSAEGSSDASGLLINSDRGKSNTFENDLLRLIFLAEGIEGLADNASVAPLENLYISLHSGDPGEAGDQETNEITYTNYARVAVPRDETGWSVVGHQVSNLGEIVFPQPGDALETITYVAIGTEAAGPGKILYYGEATLPLQVHVDFPPRLESGELQVFED